MTLLDTDILLDWLLRRGLDGLDEAELLREFCEKCREAGLMVSRALSFIDTLHPVHEGRIYRWRDDSVEEPAATDYARTDQGGPAAESWQRSPFFHLLQTGEEELRRRIGFGEAPDFSVIQEMKDLGHTDYVVFIHRFAGDTKIGDMDGVYSAWSTRHSEGFSDANIVALRRLVPALALAIKSAALARIADTLVQVYLGRDAGRRVLEGSIQRGVADRVEAALWFSDLRSFTAITDTAKPSEVIPLLNDYAEAVITSIHEAGGDVLKLMGDGTLAIFDASDPAQGCRAALHAKDLAKERILAVSARRAEAGLPVTQAYLGLHVGEVLFGNIGSPERLDFTVVGPAVNEVARIAAMCRSVERKLLVSTDFHDAAAAEDRARLVSVGRYALRGVGAAQDLYTVVA